VINGKKRGEMKMKECPFIDECEEELTEISFCQVGSLLSYKDCPTYRRMLKAKQGKPPRQKQREWKKEKEES